MKPSKTILIPFILVAVMTTGNTWACSCAAFRDVIETAKRSELVLRAKVSEYGPPWQQGDYDLYSEMTVEIVEVIKGQYQPATLVIQAGDGGDCGLPLSSSRFKKGQEYLFVFRQSGSLQRIHICGEHVADIQGGQVQIYQSHDQFYFEPLAGFKARIKTPG